MIEQSDLSKSQIDRNDRYLCREHQADQHNEKDAVSSREGQPGEGESCKGAGDELTEGDENRDLHAIPVDLQKRDTGAEDRLIVPEIECRWEEARWHSVCL